MLKRCQELHPSVTILQVSIINQVRGCIPRLRARTFLPVALCFFSQTKASFQGSFILLVLRTFGKAIDRQIADEFTQARALRATVLNQGTHATRDLLIARSNITTTLSFLEGPDFFRHILIFLQLPSPGGTNRSSTAVNLAPYQPSQKRWSFPYNTTRISSNPCAQRTRVRSAKQSRGPPGPPEKCSRLLGFETYCRRKEEHLSSQVPRDTGFGPESEYNTREQRTVTRTKLLKTEYSR